MTKTNPEANPSLRLAWIPFLRDTLCVAALPGYCSDEQCNQLEAQDKFRYPGMYRHGCEIPMTLCRRPGGAFTSRIAVTGRIFGRTIGKYARAEQL
jgi:hypothetical protein